MRKHIGYHDSYSTVIASHPSLSLRAEGVAIREEQNSKFEMLNNIK